MRAVVYSRVSSRQQRDRHTIDSQLRELPAFVARQGWELVRPPATYVDDGRSASAGKLDLREAFGRLLKDAASGAFDVVAIVDLDRITRSADPAERGLILAAFQAAGVQLAPMSGGRVDLGTFEGEVMGTLQMILAAAENKKRTAAFLRGIDEAIRQGKKPRGKTPYGLAYDVPTGTWSLHPLEAPIVKELYERVVAGETATAVGRDLEDRLVAGPRGGRWITAIWRLVARSTYRGVLVVDRKRGLEVAVPRIVDDALWYAAQDAMAQHGRRGLRRMKYPYLCEGLAVCGLCGADMWTHHEVTRRANGRRYYACSHRMRPPARGVRCMLPFHRVDGPGGADAQLWGELAALLLRPDYLQLFGAWDAQVAGDHARWAEDLAGFKRRIAQLVDAEAAILERFRKGLISAPAMDRHLKGSARERAFLAQQVSTARQEAGTPGAPKGQAIVERLATARGRVPGATPEERRALVRLMVAPGAITFAPTGITSVLRFVDAPCDGASLSPEKPGPSQGEIRMLLRVVSHR